MAHFLVSKPMALLHLGSDAGAHHAPGAGSGIGSLLGSPLPLVALTLAALLILWRLQRSRTSV